MELRRLLFADFETGGIDPRPEYPPKPVGLALLCPQERVDKYYAWGHPSGSGNNCELENARAHYLMLLRAGYVPVFHNAAFDLDVAETHLGIPWPPEHHDTLLLAFLADPRSPSFSLKPLAERYLGEPPVERDLVREWVLAHVPEARRAKTKWGRYICLAPVSLVGPYARGDNSRTRGLFLKFAKDVLSDPEQRRAYERERRLTRVLVGMERRGIPVATRRLKRDVPVYEAAQGKLEVKLMDRLKVARSKREDFCWSGEGFADQLERARAVKEWILTAKGQRRTGTDSLLEVGCDVKLVRELEVRAQLQTCLSTFMRPWLAQGLEYDGHCFARFNQVRQNYHDGGDGNGRLVGAETGRISMTPNLQNVIRSDKDPRVPPVRDYIVPGGTGLSLVQRDYCFSADTEALTECGWRLFKDLDRTERLAQWKDGRVTFAKPLKYQKVRYRGDMVHVTGRQTDLFVTPNHNCLLLVNGVPRTVRAADYICGRGARQPHAGRLTGTKTIREAELIVACAVQADAKVERALNGWRAIFYLKKQRKVERLVGALLELGLTPTTAVVQSKPDRVSVRIVFPRVNVLNIGIEAGKVVKLFDLRALLRLTLALRQFFLRELMLWDGSKNSGGQGWRYGTIVKRNADTVQAVAAVSDFRSKIGGWITRAEKPFYSVLMTDRTSATYTDDYEKVFEPYDGHVYCVTMPQSTVIVRRSGRVCITSQSQQELRILAHYEDGPFLAKYLANPKIDAHVAIGELIHELIGIELARRDVKDLNFGLLYGMGQAKLALKLLRPIGETRKLYRAHQAALPGVKRLKEQLDDAGRNGQPIYTWGGRRYFCEPERWDEATQRVWNFAYRLLNLKIQGSAADVTKQAMINYDEAGANAKWPLLLQVHDELLATAKARETNLAHNALNEAMLDVKFKVPMLSDGKTGRISWHRMKKETRL